MSHTVQQLISLAARFEKMAVDIPQPLNFGDDYEKYQEMIDPKPDNDDDAYQKWLKGPDTLEEEIPVEKVEEPLPEGIEVIDDLPIVKDDALAKYKEDQGADTYIRTAAKKKVDLKSKDSSKDKKKDSKKEKDSKKSSKKSSATERLLAKYASVEAMTNFLSSNYEGTAALLRDLAKAQFTVGDNDPNDTAHENYATNKQLHDMIMALADQIEPIEQTMW